MVTPNEEGGPNEDRGTPERADAPQAATPPPGTAPTPLPGAVTVQHIRCGKAGCRCMNGGRRHGPYHYRVWREGGRVRKEYVPLGEVERVRAACEAYRREPAPTFIRIALDAGA